MFETVAKQITQALGFPLRPLPTPAVGLPGNSWWLLNVLCLFNCSFPGSSWCGGPSVGHFSEAQPQGAVTLHQREVPEGAQAFLEPRLHLCIGQPLQRLVGPVINWKEKKKGKREKNRAKEDNKEMFHDSNKNEREYIPLLRNCI